MSVSAPPGFTESEPPAIRPDRSRPDRAGTDPSTDPSTDPGTDPGTGLGAGRPGRPLSSRRP